MKKFAAFVLAIVLSIMMCCAFAEVRNYAMAGITDPDGNILYLVQEDRTVTDGDGNPVDGVPYLTLSIDDMAMSFEMSSPGKTVTGTVAVVETTDELLTLQLTPEGGEAITAYITAETPDAIALMDDVNNMMVILFEEV